MEACTPHKVQRTRNRCRGFEKRRKNGEKAIQTQIVVRVINDCLNNKKHDNVYESIQTCAQISCFYQNMNTLPKIFQLDRQILIKYVYLQLLWTATQHNVRKLVTLLCYIYVVNTYSSICSKKLCSLINKQTYVLHKYCK